MIHKLWYKGALGILKVRCYANYAPPGTLYSNYWKDVTCPTCLAKRK